MTRYVLSILLTILITFPMMAQEKEKTKPIKILFLGDNGHHRPALRFRQLYPVMLKRGIDITYTDKVTALDPKVLNSYDGLIIYANTTEITPAQEKALLDYVEGGKGFIPLHCASYCFIRSQKYIDLVGAQFLRHGTGTFRTTNAKPEHPIMKGFAGFESWDETYVHTKHNEKNRTVLEYRSERGRKEPWTWIRNQGKGRVFYTAWGHDQRTWGNPGFQDLVERGIRWTVGKPVFSSGPKAAHIDTPFPIPQMTTLPKDLKPFEFLDVGKKIPNYTPSRRWGVQGEPFNKMQKPVDAEESMKHIVVPKGFHVELFVSEKQLGGKPICMNWDQRGRLWAALTYDYPNQLQPHGQGRDRIVVCEDTDGDFTADKVTVFAEKLSIPTSLIPARGGLIVFDGTQTVFLKDTDGDDKADERTVLFGRWNQRDTHGGPSNMRYGLDNWIWAMQGYNNSTLTVGGETHRFRQGFFRFKPDASKLEFIRSTDNNTWGLGISEEGLIFGSTANRNPSVFMPIPNRFYEQVRGWTPSLTLRSIADTHLFKPITDKVRQVDQHGGYTAGAGHALYTARKYPKEYWNRTAFVNGPTGHLIGTFVLRRNGSEFRSRNSFNLFASDDEWTAPIMSEIGPDGNVWVIDWYNYIIQHNPTPQGFKTGKGAAYETELRDRKHGRIYRIVYDKAEPAKPFSLKDADTKTLIRTLGHDTMLWRLHAQRLLVERGKKDVVPALVEMVKDGSVDEIGLNTGVIHALWTLHGLGAVDAKNDNVMSVIFDALKHKSAGVRRNAVAVLPKGESSVKAILDAGLLKDDEPQVRLSALLTLATLEPSSDAGSAIAAMIVEQRNYADRWIPNAAISAASAHDLYFLQSVVASKAEVPSQVMGMVSVVAEHYARGGPTQSVNELLASLGTAKPEMAETMITALNKGWPASKPAKLTEASEKALAQLLTRITPGAKSQLLRLASAWGSSNFAKYTKEIVETLMTNVTDENASDPKRINAAKQLMSFRPNDADVVKELLTLISVRASPTLSAGILEAVGESEAKSTGRMILTAMKGMTPSQRQNAIRSLLNRPSTTLALLAAIGKGEAQLGELSLDQKQFLTNHPNREVSQQAKTILARSGGLPNPDREKVLKEWLSIVKKEGSAKRGLEVFKKHCAKCHVHGKEGNRIGPDLTGMAVHPKEELLTNILDPSRNVEGNFRSYSVRTRRGKVYVGMLGAETRTSLELFDVEGKKKVLLRESVEQVIASTKSLMPEGFEKQIKQEEMVDLLELLTQRGKYLPIPLNKVATIVSTKGMFFRKDAEVERLIFPDWKPKVFEGVPFQLIDPKGDRVPNVVMLYGPNGTFPPKMPKSVKLPCNSSAKMIHFLSGVSGWGHPYHRPKSVSMIVRLHYEDGKTEDHELKNGVHFADYIRRVDVPESKFAFRLRNQQIRYLVVTPKRGEAIKEIELVKGDDQTAPVVMALTVESAE